jgi:hypothetical protein
MLDAAERNGVRFDAVQPPSLSWMRGHGAICARIELGAVIAWATPSARSARAMRIRTESSSITGTRAGATEQNAAFVTFCRAPYVRQLMDAECRFLHSEACD